MVGGSWCLPVTCTYQPNDLTTRYCASGLPLPGKSSISLAKSVIQTRMGGFEVGDVSVTYRVHLLKISLVSGLRDCEGPFVS